MLDCRACADPVNLILHTYRGTALATNTQRKHLLTEVDIGQAILWTERAEEHTNSPFAAAALMKLKKKCKKNSQTTPATHDAKVCVVTRALYSTCVEPTPLH